MRNGGSIPPGIMDIGFSISNKVKGKVIALQLNAGLFWVLMCFSIFGVGYLLVSFVDGYNRRKRRIRRTARTLKVLSSDMQYIRTQYAALSRKLADVETEMQSIKTQMAEMAASIDLTEEEIVNGDGQNAENESGAEKG